MSQVAALVGNKVELGVSARYAGIIGERPSQGARSPSLWNAVFQAENLDVRFHPFDVAAERLGAVVAALKADPRFIGGSVTMPHKAAILPFLDRVDPLATAIGAVNALYRDGDALVGTNTDGAGAVSTLLAKLGESSLGARKVVVLGTGGAGAAVAVFLADSLTESGELVLCNRSRDKAVALAARMSRPARVSSLPPTADDVRDADVVVNCTSLGFATAADEGKPKPERMMTALASTNDVVANWRTSCDLLATAKPEAVVYDIIYQPAMTPLLTLAAGLGRRVLGGLGMNLEQAVIAFCRAMPGQVSADRVRAVMAGVP